jgi:hypothetical protein
MADLEPSGAIHCFGCQEEAAERRDILLVGGETRPWPPPKWVLFMCRTVFHQDAR